MPVLTGLVIVLIKLKHLSYLFGNPLIGSQQAMIAIQTCRILVEITGPDMTIQHVFTMLTAGNEEQLTVHLQPGHTINNLGTFLIEPVCPPDVVFLIKARLQFQTAVTSFPFRIALMREFAICEFLDNL